MTRRLPKDIEEKVRLRAKHLCEYCRFPQSASKFVFEVEHIIPRKHQGSHHLDNLALACGYCNRCKGTNIAGIDPATGQMTRLFNPRSDPWGEHFRWQGPILVGHTDIGRTTVAVLTINQHHQVAARQTIIDEGIFPPD